ncbi:MAG: DUF2752 domain-containing protein [Bacteroidaceae bacterium]|nr:DUF2752 domain-containing protein [Bacteroidaceae bacterium]
MRRKLIACILVLCVVACVALYYLDPVEYVFMPKCPFKLITGLDCPGCGFQRAMHALLHGHVVQAIKFNLFLVFSVPYLLALIVCYYFLTGERSRKTLSFLEGKTMAFTYIILYFVWFVVRNILHI